MSTQQAQKTHFLHDVPFVCHMCADHFATYVLTNLDFLFVYKIFLFDHAVGGTLRAVSTNQLQAQLPAGGKLRKFHLAANPRGFSPRKTNANGEMVFTMQSFLHRQSNRLTHSDFHTNKEKIHLNYDSQQFFVK